MRGSTFVLAACVPSCLALAAGDPPGTPKRQLVSSGCDLPLCQSVKDKVGCVQPLISLGGGSVDQLVACVGGNEQLLCSCAGCVTGLVDFLTDNSVC